MVVRYRFGVIDPRVRLPKANFDVTPREILSTIQAMRANAAPGLDIILWRCIKMCCGTLLPWLQRILVVP